MKENKIIEFLDDTNNSTTIDKAISVRLELLGRAEEETFLISIESLQKVLRHEWYLDPNGYPKSYRARGHTLHRYLMGKQEKGMVIDHINRIKTDNRLQNLRIITAKENSYNRTKSSKSNNAYKGVQKRGDKYVATISKDGKTHQIGGFKTEEDAAKVYDLMAGQLFGRFAGLNFNE
jgi:hypothetical protein